MNDPHVASLEYALRTDDSLTFNNPPPLEGDAAGFTYRLADGVLTVTMKYHYATQEDAVEAVRSFIQAWELDYALRQGRRELRFSFVRSNIIDRQPTPGHVLLVGTAKFTITAHPVTLMVTRRQYPAPPASFAASPDVQTLWNRYEGHLLGREPLPSMGYFCLSVVQALYGGRAKAVGALNIDRPVLDTLGLLTSERGDATTARKQEGKTLQPLAPSEERWIHETLRLMIRRVAMERAGAVSSAPLTMNDLPKL